MAPRRFTWLSTEMAGAEVGMSAEWTRQQIVAGRLRATVFSIGNRRTYRIRSDDWSAFLAAYARRTDDPTWE